MSASQNADSVQPGTEIRSRGIHEPLERHGHHPGIKVGKETVPEFQAQTLPAGTAPPESTFKPNPTSEVPGQANNPDTATQTKASDTLGGATSADVYTGLGKPMQGETSTELRHDGKHGRERERKGLGGLAPGVTGSNQATDERIDAKQRGFERETGDIAGKKAGTGQEKGIPAEDREPVSAEQL